MMRIAEEISLKAFRSHASPDVLAQSGPSGSQGVLRTAWPD